MIYAWNEFGEGGFIAPTVGDPDGLYLDAIKSVVLVPVPCDVNTDKLCGVFDSRVMMNQRHLVTRVSVGTGNAFDLKSDSIIHEADISEWLVLAGTRNDYGSPMLRGDTDGLGNVFPTPLSTVF